MGYIYIYIEREREKERERGGKEGRKAERAMTVRKLQFQRVFS